MSQMVTRQGPVGEDIDKRQTASPVKEMKKKMAANAEKEKIATEKHGDKPTDKHADKADKIADRKDKKEAEKHTDKTAEKKDKSADKSHDKKDKTADKSIDKKDKAADKPVEKKDKAVEKKDKSVEKKDKGKDVDKLGEKTSEKKEATAEKHVEQTDESKSVDKAEKEKTKDEDKRKAETVKHNGEASRAQNGKASNGTASESDDGDEELVIVEPDNDEMFPELAYDDTSDTELIDTDVGRSVTRRSQVKVTRTPETPRPASVKQADKETDDSKEMKLLKLKEDIVITDRRLRSANSPKPSEKRPQEKDSPKKTSDPAKKSESEMKTVEEGTEDSQEHAQKSEGTVTEMVIEVETSEGGETRRDTRYSRSRVKVSPYRRSARLADHTASSVLANYTGNNTTMEMDITESSLVSEEGASEAGAGGEDSYLAALRTVRARRSYRDLKPLSLSHASFSTTHSASNLSARESNVRPTGTVVGRKRRPEAGEGGAGAEAGETEREAEAGGEGIKRPRLLERLARPFRAHTSTPLPARRAAEIVGINTDLPQSAPVAADDAFDPETIKPTPTPTLVHAGKATPTVMPTLAHAKPTPMLSERDSKRCVVM